MIKGLQRLVLITLLAGIPALAQQDGSKGTPQPDTQPTAQAGSSTPQHKATDDPNYVIGPQDVIDVNVWKEADISRTVPVRPDGKISLPLLNDVQAAGLTPTQLGAQITASLKKFVTDPQVTVIVT